MKKEIGIIGFFLGGINAMDILLTLLYLKKTFQGYSKF